MTDKPFDDKMRELAERHASETWAKHVPSRTASATPVKQERWEDAVEDFLAKLRAGRSN